MEQENSEVMNYAAVKITAPSDTSEGTDVDAYAVVPTDWIYHAEKSPNDFYVKYLPSDNAEDILLTKQLCEAKFPPPDDWLLYACIIIGKAQSMVQASQLIGREKSLAMKSIGKGSAKKNVNRKKELSNEAKRKVLAHKSNQIQIQFSESIQNLLGNIQALSDEGQDGFNLPAAVFSNQKSEIVSGTIQHDSTAHDMSSSPDSHNVEPEKTVHYEVIDEKIESSKDDPSIRAGNSKPSITNDLDVQMLDNKFNEILKAIDVLSKKLTALERSSNGLEKSMLDITKHLQELKTFTMCQRRLKDNANIISFTQLKSMHDLKLPLQSIAEFEDFEKKLADNNNHLAQDLKTYVFSTVNTTIRELEKNLRPIIRSFISQRVALGMTAQKPIANKITFSSTNFGQILKDCFTNVYADPAIAGPKHFDSAMGTVLNTKKQWSQTQDVDNQD